MSSAKSAAQGRIQAKELAPGLCEWRIDHAARRNAVTPTMLHEIRNLAAQSTGGVVMLTSTDPDFFCAGFDLGALDLGDELPDQPLIAASAALRRCKAVTIAVLDGAVIGAGAELACSCDLIVATPLTHFRIPAAQLAVVYHGEGLDHLTQCLGLPLVRRLILSADTIFSDDPQLRPAFCQVVDRDVLPMRALELAQRVLAAPSAALQANAAWLRPPVDRSTEEKLAHDFARQTAYRSLEHRQALAQRVSSRHKARKT